MAKREEDPFLLKGFWFEKAIMGALALFLIAVGVILLPVVPRSETGPVLFVYGFLSLMLLIPLTALYRSFTWLRVYRQGIFSYTPFRAIRFLAWGKIAQIRSSAWGSTLILADDTGRTKVGVYSSLGNSRYFIGWLLQMRPDIWRPEERLTFTKSSVIAFFFIIASVGSLALALTFPIDESYGFWLFIGNALACVGFLLLLPYSLAIHGDSLLLRHPFRERILHADQIGSIERLYQPPGYVQIKLKSGASISLYFFSLGADMLFGFLWSWHTQLTQPKLPPPAMVPSALQVPPHLLQPPKLELPPPSED